jgi:hypothetical protein
MKKYPEAGHITKLRDTAPPAPQRVAKEIDVAESYPSRTEAILAVVCTLTLLSFSIVGCVLFWRLHDFLSFVAWTFFGFLSWHRRPTRPYRNRWLEFLDHLRDFFHPRH